MESYPPLFRDQIHSRSNDDLETTIIIKEENTAVDDDGIHTIPTVDLQSLEPKQLEDACKNWGIFRLVNHQVPPLLLSQLQEQAKNLFSLSFDDKQNTLSSPLSYFWGTPVLTPSGSALPHQNLHWLEGLNVPVSHLSHSPTTHHPLLHSFRYLIDPFRDPLISLA